MQLEENYQRRISVSQPDTKQSYHPGTTLTVTVFKWEHVPKFLLFHSNLPTNIAFDFIKERHVVPFTSHETSEILLSLTL